MSGWDRIIEGIATLAVASLAWISGIAAPMLPADATTGAGDEMSLMLRWSQDETTDPLIQPVQESQGDDIETLDDAGQGVQELSRASDDEPQDAAPLDPTGQEDIELLDQGAPPGAPAAAAAPITADPIAAAPVVTTGAPAVAVAPVVTGPVLPPGFGTGQVHVSAGSAGFPVGLESCHVGAVTGRAYVGIDCGEGSSFVGHAPSFEEFPFVLDEAFPFDSSETVRTAPVAAAEPESSGIFVSSNTGVLNDIAEEPVLPRVETTGNASVGLAQQARDRQPRDRTENRGANRVQSSGKGGNDQVAAQGADDRQRQAKSESKKQKAKDRKDTSKDKKTHKGKGKDKDKKRDHGKKNGKRSSDRR